MILQPCAANFRATLKRFALRLTIWTARYAAYKEKKYHCFLSTICLKWRTSFIAPRKYPTSTWWPHRSWNPNAMPFGPQVAQLPSGNNSNGAQAHDQVHQLSRRISRTRIPRWIIIQLLIPSKLVLVPSGMHSPTMSMMASTPPTLNYIKIGHSRRPHRQRSRWSCDKVQNRSPNGDANRASVL